MLGTVRGRRVTLLDAPVDDLTMAEAIACVQQMIAEGGAHQLTPINANKLWQMRHNPELDRIVRGSTLVLPEWAMVWASRRLGRPVRGHIGGVTLLQAFLPVAARHGYRLFLFGARPAVVEALARHVIAAFPGLELAGYHHGYVSPAEEPALIETIEASRADFLLVAMGTPKQELWIAKYKAELGVPVTMGVGGSFDVLAGLKSDTPDWARGRGLEWLYRLALDPRNLWKRYLLTNPWFVYQVLRERLGVQRSRTARSD
jgi:N-acetylglucosaminyldiphosphoundecaprenol N-acetyl-beta-D-mannosaminyltransferase